MKIIAYNQEMGRSGIWDLGTSGTRWLWLSLPSSIPIPRNQCHRGHSVDGEMESPKGFTSILLLTLADVLGWGWDTGKQWWWNRGGGGIVHWSLWRGCDYNSNQFQDDSKSNWFGDMGNDEKSRDGEAGWTGGDSELSSAACALLCWLWINSIPRCVSLQSPSPDPTITIDLHKRSITNVMLSQGFVGWAGQGRIVGLLSPQPPQSIPYSIHGID